MAVDVVVARPTARTAIETRLSRYLRELAPFHAKSARPRAPYPYLAAYWSDPERHPFTIRRRGRVVGFAFVRELRRSGAKAMQIAEFCVDRAARRHGVGTAAAARLWARFPGRWELDVLAHNAVAVAFWRSCLRSHGIVARASRVRARDGTRLRLRFSMR